MTDDAARRGDELRDAGLMQRFDPGAEIFAAGDAAECAYVLLSGRAVVIDGGEQVSVVVPGDLFGELGVLGDGTRTATVRAVEPSEVLLVPSDQWRQRIGASPEALWACLELVVSRTRSINARQVRFGDEQRALRDVQRSLLPDLGALDVAAGFTAQSFWAPCVYASGDYVDVVRIDAHRHLLAVGDVMGHGAESSLMMAIARAEVRELARSARRTDELLLRLDGYLRDNAPPRQGMSLVVALIDGEEQTIEYASAGHPLPLLVRGGEAVELPGRSGILLALPFLVGSGYERHVVAVEPDDRLLMFTDGMFEVPAGPDGAELGRHGLSDLLVDVVRAGPDDLLTALVGRIEALAGDAAGDDDRAALLVTVAG